MALTSLTLRKLARPPCKAICVGKFKDETRRDGAVGCDGVTFILSLVQIYELIWKFNGD